MNITFLLMLLPFIVTRSTSNRTATRKRLPYDPLQRILWNFRLFRKH